MILTDKQQQHVDALRRAILETEEKLARAAPKDKRGQAGLKRKLSHCRYLLDHYLAVKKSGWRKNERRAARVRAGLPVQPRRSGVL